jgi:hypothetical protein
MDRRSRHRIGKCEELLSAALKESDEKLKKLLQVLPPVLDVTQPQ